MVLSDMEWGSPGQHRCRLLKMEHTEDVDEGLENGRVGQREEPLFRSTTEFSPNGSSARGTWILMEFGAKRRTSVREMQRRGSGLRSYLLRCRLLMGRWNGKGRAELSLDGMLMLPSRSRKSGRVTVW